MGSRAGYFNKGGVYISRVGRLLYVYTAIERERERCTRASKNAKLSCAGCSSIFIYIYLLANTFAANLRRYFVHLERKKNCIYHTHAECNILRLGARHVMAIFYLIARVV